MAFMRAYQMLSGDALFSPLVPKRKAAGAGPRMKSFRKRTVRQRRMLRSAALAGDPFLGALISGLPLAAKALPKLGAVGGKLGGLMGRLGGLLRGKGGAALGGALTGISLPGLIPGPKPGGLPPSFWPGSDLGMPGLPFGAETGAPSARARGFDGAGVGRTRRSINPANVKALRRGLRRVEMFKGLVKRVDKLMPSGAKFSGQRSRHGKGCRCARCK